MKADRWSLDVYIWTPGMGKCMVNIQWERKQQSLPMAPRRPMSAIIMRAQILKLLQRLPGAEPQQWGQNSPPLQLQLACQKVFRQRA